MTVQSAWGPVDRVPLITAVPILLVAELLYSLQWCEELDNPPPIVTGFSVMLQNMNITYGSLSVLGNTSSLLQLLFDR